MQRPIKPEWLLRQADELGGRWSTSGQPRNADLRRAVSSAYYALFHSIALCASEHVLYGCTQEDIQRFSRQFTHKGIKDVCNWVALNGRPPEHLQAILEPVHKSRDLLDVALAFPDLQEARHAADYDHFAALNRPETLAFVDRSRDSIRKLTDRRGTRNYKRFMAALVARAAK